TPRLDASPARPSFRSARMRGRGGGVARWRLNVVYINNCFRSYRMTLIKPHGGKLINREVTGEERQRLIDGSAHMPRLQLGARAISDLEMIAVGAYSPLAGFMDSCNYKSVLSRMRLAD